MTNYWEMIFLRVSRRWRERGLLSCRVMFGWERFSVGVESDFALLPEDNLSNRVGSGERKADFLLLPFEVCKCDFLRKLLMMHSSLFSRFKCMIHFPSSFIETLDDLQNGRTDQVINSENHWKESIPAIIFAVCSFWLQEWCFLQEVRSNGRKFAIWKYRKRKYF